MKKKPQNFIDNMILRQNHILATCEITHFTNLPDLYFRNDKQFMTRSVVEDTQKKR